MASMTSKQLTILAVIIAMTGAGSSLLHSQAPQGPSPYLAHVAVLREQLDRLERRHEALMRRVRDLEKEQTNG